MLCCFLPYNSVNQPLSIHMPPASWISLPSLSAAAAKLLQSCPTVRPHRRQPIGLPCPWDSPGKSTGVGCHFLLQYMKVKSESEVTQSCPTLGDPMDCSLPGSSIRGIFQARVLEWGARTNSSQSEIWRQFLFPLESFLACGLWLPYSFLDATWMLHLFGWHGQLCVCMCVCMHARTCVEMCRCEST